MRFAVSTDIPRMTRANTHGTHAYRQIQFKLSCKAEHARIAKGRTSLRPQSQVTLANVTGSIPVIFCIRSIVVDIERGTDIHIFRKTYSAKEVTRGRKLVMVIALFNSIIIKNTPTRKRPRVKSDITTGTSNDLSRSQSSCTNLVNTVEAAHQTCLGKTGHRNHQNEGA